MSRCYHCGTDSPSRYCCLEKALETSEFEALHSLCTGSSCIHKKEKMDTVNTQILKAKKAIVYKLCVKIMYVNVLNTTH